MLVALEKTVLGKDMPIVSKQLKDVEQPTTNKPEKPDYITQLTDQILPSFTIKKLVNFQRNNSPLKSMRQCHTRPIYTFNPSDKTENITLRVNEYGYRASGLNRCKNPYCPLCSKARAGERYHKLKDGLTGAMLQKMPTYFVTLTIPRDKDIKKQVSELRHRWKQLQNSFTYLKQKLGVEVYTAKALDITFNPNYRNHRYHLHIHSIIVLSHEVSVDFEKLIRDKWTKSNHQKCFVHPVHGIDIQRVENTQTDRKKVSKYLSKMAGLALELSNSNNKNTKSNSSVSLVELMLGEKSDGTKLDTKKCQLIYKEFLHGMYRTNTLNHSKNWVNLMIVEDDEGEDREEIEINIHVQNWNHIKNYWFMIAEKIQYEIFLVPEWKKVKPFRHQKIIGMATAFLNSQPNMQQVYSFCAMEL